MKFLFLLESNINKKIANVVKIKVCFILESLITLF